MLFTVRCKNWQHLVWGMMALTLRSEGVLKWTQLVGRTNFPGLLSWTKFSKLNQLLNQSTLSSLAMFLYPAPALLLVLKWMKTVSSVLLFLCWLSVAIKIAHYWSVKEPTSYLFWTLSWLWSYWRQTDPVFDRKQVETSPSKRSWLVCFVPYQSSSKEPGQGGKHSLFQNNFSKWPRCTEHPKSSLALV